MRSALVVPKRFFDDPQRVEAQAFYDAELDKITQMIVRLPLDTDNWQELQRDFNSLRVRMEVVQLLAYLITAEKRYNKNILPQRRVDKPCTFEQCKEHVEEARRTVMRFPVESSFQRNNVTLNRIQLLNRIEFEE